jgi:hypothetical protein
MSIPAHVYGFRSFDYHTEAANTAIVEYIDPIDGARLVVMNLSYTAAATAHTASLMHAGGVGGTGSRNVASALALSGQKVINVVNTPLDPAGNGAAASDVIAFQLIDGTWEWDTVASVAVKAITCSNNITGVDAGAGGTAIAAGAKVMILGVVADAVAEQISLPAATLVEYGKGELTIAHPYVGEPWMLSITNATNAGFLWNALFAHINK